MGADDVITVLYHEGQWYVAHTQGGNYQEAIHSQHSFSTKVEALLYADALSERIGTEYGVRIHK